MKWEQGYVAGFMEYTPMHRCTRALLYYQFSVWLCLVADNVYTACGSLGIQGTNWIACFGFWQPEVKVNSGELRWTEVNRGKLRGTQENQQWRWISSWSNCVLIENFILWLCLIQWYFCSIAPLPLRDFKNTPLSEKPQQQWMERSILTAWWLVPGSAVWTLRITSRSTPGDNLGPNITLSRWE